MLQLVPLLASALVLSAPAHPFHTNAGISGVLPAGWHVVHRRLTHCSDPHEVLALASYRLAARPALAPGGAFVLLEERADPREDRLPPRPGRFALAGAAHALVCCEPFRAAGWSVDFRASGRAFYGYAYLGARAAPERRAQLLRILDGLRIAAPPRVRWRRSEAIGLPWNGRLVRGVQLPSWGRAFYTWDPLLHRSPDRADRRWGTDRLVRKVLGVVQAFAAANGGVRVGIGDLSRPHGGYFGPRHESHRNGLDVDVYYPRLDGLERPPDVPSQIDRRLSLDLLRLFVRAGAAKIFVGPNTRLPTGGVVQELAGHDNHMHVRIAAARDAAWPRTRLTSAVANLHAVRIVARSVDGRPIRLWRIGNPASPRKVLVVGCIHGTECAGTAIVQQLVNLAHPVALDLWIVPDLNPDGLARGTRLNAHGVDLNRNFSASWRGGGRRWDPEYAGPRPFSEPETRAARALVLRLRPAITIWYHQPLDLVRAWGPSVPAARRYARLAGLPFRAMPWLAGTAPNWQNHRLPGTSSFVVELPPGPLSPAAAARHARAVLALAE